jgi:hypothetical protein
MVSADVSAEIARLEVGNLHAMSDFDPGELEIARVV